MVPNLKVLQLSGNPIIYPKQEVIQEGVQYITSYLKKEYEALQQEQQEMSIQEYHNDIACVVSDKPKKSIMKKDNNDKYAKPTVKVKAFRGESKCSVISTHSRRHQKFHTLYSKTSGSKNSKEYPRFNSDRYLSAVKARKNDVRIEEQQLKDIWLKKLKELMSSQDDELQKAK